MGAIIGALIGRKYAEKIAGDKMMAQHVWNTIQDATFNPNTEQSPEAYQHALDFFGKKYVGKGDQEKWDNFVNLSKQHAAVYQKIRQPLPNPNGATANPASAPSGMLPQPSGGIGMPDSAQGSAGMMSQGPQVPTGIAGLLAQKKTIDLAPPAQAVSSPIAASAPQVLVRQMTAPDADNPGVNSSVASPGFAGWTPRPEFGEQPGDMQPANDRRVSPSVVGRRAAARIMPVKRAEYEAMYGAQYDLYDKKFKEVTSWIDQYNKRNPDSDVEYTMEMGVNGMPIVKMDRGANVGQPVTGNLLSPSAKIVGGGPRDESMTYQQRTYGNGSVKAFPISPILRQGFAPDAAGNPTAVQYNSRVPGSAAGIKPLATFNPKLFNVGSGVSLASPNQIAAQGGVPPPIPGTIGSGAPVTRTSTRDQIVDMGDRKDVVPISAAATSRRGGAGLPAPNPMPPGVPASPAAGGRRQLGPKGLSPVQTLGMQNAITMGTHQLFGDPDDPSLKPLSSYSRLADDPGAKQRLGKAFNLLLHAAGPGGAANIGADVGPISMSTGGIGDWLQNSLGITAAAAGAKAAVIHDAIAELKPEESEYLNKMMNAIPTITGYRKLTSAGAFRWSQDSLERELPFIGLSTTDSRSFNQKMQNLGNEPLTAIRNLGKTNPGAIDPRLAGMIRGVKPLPAAGMTPPASGNVPAVGTVMKGYRFKGGNPADQASWEKVP